MRFAPQWLRRLEISLWIIGISLLGGTLGATWDRWLYQQSQEEALFGAPLPAPASEPAPVGPAQPQGPSPRVAVNDPFVGPAAPVARPQARQAPRDRPQRNPRQLDPTVVGRIEIPRLGLRAIVREGADHATLARAVGLVPNSARPGENGNMVLAGHRDTFFRPLRKVRVGDVVRLVRPDGTFDYRVDALHVVKPEETSVLQSRGVEELTLVTCYPFRFIGPAPERFIVSASRIGEGAATARIHGDRSRETAREAARASL